MKRAILFTFFTFIVIGLYSQGIDSSNYFFFHQVKSELKSGNTALSFNYIDENDNEINLSDFKGQIIYLDIWASYCSYCVSQIPEILKLQEKYPSIAVIKVSVDEKKQAWLNASKRVTEMASKNQPFSSPESSRSALSPGELSARWGVTRQTLYNMFQSGELHSFTVRTRRLIPLTEVERIEKGEAA